MPELPSFVDAEVFAKIVNGEFPPLNGRMNPVWFADTNPEGGMNGTIYIRAYCYDPNMELPLGWDAAPGSVTIDARVYYPFRHYRFWFRMPSRVTTDYLLRNGSASVMSNVTDVACASLITQISGMGWVDAMIRGSFGASKYVHAVLAEDGMISCLPRNRHQPELPIWNQKGRVVVRPGKFFRGMGYYSDSEIEAAVNEWNAAFVPTEAEFKIVRGKEIKDYYLERSYADENTGTLGSSCMRYRRCQSYLNIYSQNRNKVGLLILQRPDGKIIGRALVWSLDDGKTFMDRVYGTDVTMRRFFDYAATRGWHRRANQSYDSKRGVVSPRGDSDNLNMTITLNTRRWERYPFMDTFAYIGDGYIANYPVDGYVGFAQCTNGAVGRVNAGTCHGCGGYLSGSLWQEAHGHFCETCAEAGWRYCPECDHPLNPFDTRPCRNCEELRFNDPATHYWSAAMWLSYDAPTSPPVGTWHDLHAVGYTLAGRNILRDLGGALWVITGPNYRSVRPVMEGEAHTMWVDHPLQPARFSDETLEELTSLVTRAIEQERAIIRHA